MTWKPHQMGLFGAQAAEHHLRMRWPDASRFPLNIGKDHVQQKVWQDLLHSPAPLIVAGYSSLDQIIDFIASAEQADSIRLLFGHEPFDARRSEFRLNRDGYAREVEAYWLRQGISLLRCSAVIRALEVLESGRAQARYMAGQRVLHAKIYCAEGAATLGSSNFTDAGLRRQLEANARFERRKDAARYRELVQVAENYWTLGVDFQAQLIALLKKLLKPVSWQEALARACAELLEGEWAQAYLREGYLGEAGSLWPSQKQGIAQALAILSERGSVLIADATGAGKTRMGVYLAGAVSDHIVRTGRLRQGRALMICPPAVRHAWDREAMAANIHLETFSHGGLSHGSSGAHELGVESLRRAQVLCVDEGHNFLRLTSNRTKLLLSNMADHVVALTATPINRGVNDLLRIADVLGADNLEDSTLKAFQRMLCGRDWSRTLSEEEVEQLRAEIGRFTVRRTKRVLNALIDREPQAYQDHRGQPCRFPRHRPKVYRLDEPDADRAIATQIRALVDTLYGVTHFVRRIEMPESLRRGEVTEEGYLKGRLSSAKKLAGYQIMSALRSSRAALLEHLHGSEVAIERFGITGFGKKTDTGNLIDRISKLSRPPTHNLSIELPAWLTDAEAHAEACSHDLNVYKQIAALVPQLSAQREQAKEALLLKLVSRKGLVLAFDSRPITLALIRQLIGETSGVEALLAWGDAGSDRKRVLNAFAPGSTDAGIIALCSDSLSEGVNLQQASVLVHLDMPSVVRIAEQRVGRVDRLDSPHREIEAWWPEDAPEFALSSDHRFVERYDTVERLLGSNMPLPDHLQAEVAAAPVPTGEMIEALEKEAEETWDGIEDAFQPVRSLVDGECPLVEPKIYSRYRSVTERVMARVSLVDARRPWAFFCLNAGTFNAPRWVYLPETGEPKFELADVAAALRANLGDEVEDLPFDDHGTATLQQFLLRLPEIERGLLSRKKQRALDEMAICLDRLAAYAQGEGDQPLVEDIYEIQRILSDKHLDDQPDWDEMASRWLDVIRPVWFEKLASKRGRPLLLRDIRADLLAKPDRLARMVKKHFSTLPLVMPTDQRVRACIIGVSR